MTTALPWYRRALAALRCSLKLRLMLVFVLLAVTVLLASASSIRSILNLKPAEVLHGR